VTAIALVWHLDRHDDARGRVQQMVSALGPYGPHHQAIWSDGPVALGRTLYRTTPEDAHDRQPVRACDETATIIADIRLDNRDELISELDLTPRDAAVMADSEILARAWTHWEEACLPRLLGDFAFIVWDARKQRVFCARDPLGRRPLFYHRGADFIAVASMPKALLALPDVPKAVDEDLLGAFLASLPVSGTDNPFGGRSFYKGIERLPPAASLTINRDKLVVSPYWSAENVPAVRYKTDADYLEQARELFDRAVGARLRSTGPIGAELSGGLDSSSVVVTAARLLEKKGQRLTAFTAVPRPGEGVTMSSTRIADEGPLAAQTAALFPNIDHVLSPYPLISPLEPVERSLFAFDELMRNPCNQAWADEIGRRAQALGVKAMLIAPMGNATLSFDGHARFGEMLRRGNLPAWAIEMFRFARRGPRPLQKIRLQLSASLPAGLQRDLYIATRGAWQGLGERSPLSSDHRLDLDERSSPRLRGWSQARLARGSRARMIGFADVGTHLAGTLARFGFELRDPTADRRFVEFCLGVPLNQFYRRGEDKHLVRRLMRHQLPPGVLYSRVRGTQGVGWLQNMYFGREALLAEVRAARSSPVASRLLDIDALETLALAIPSGAPTSIMDVANYRHKLLHGAAAARFIRHVEGGNG